MNYRYRLARRAERYLRRLPDSQQRRVIHRIHQLCEDPRSPLRSKPLQGTEDRRSTRVGDLRILYQIDDDVAVVWVLEIRPRGDAYKAR